MSRIELGIFAVFFVGACSTTAGDDVFGSAATTGSSGVVTTSSSSGAGPGSGGSPTAAGGAGPSSSTTTAASTGPGGSGGNPGGAGPGGTGQGGTGQGGFGGNPPNTTGCSDGTREGYVDLAAQPKIAACSGGFEVPGVTTDASMQPACNRISGNDSINPQGTGCTVEDLCAEGWHVCKNALDVAQSSATGACDVSVAVAQEFWLTRQVQDAGGQCAGPPWTNNLSGCGTLGIPNDNSCSPLDQRMRYIECIPTLAWFCGNGDPDGAIEAEIVYKISSAEGGVLCCHG